MKQKQWIHAGIYIIPFLDLIVIESNIYIQDSTRYISYGMGVFLRVNTRIFMATARRA